ncbi:hypothetical protein QBC34DRAFT_459553 [Podospora aff. communis PSN243]|uniref:Uncharacterized protein n=1 Tax=Podospora aff. communis PSN243 TaxID=3040156 RepID=A0AAV9GWT6_9PEZI|nr:hypothetical protein QBC34DRAFT_459553 [Podospora aff. communis PSN243]
MDLRRILNSPNRPSDDEAEIIRSIGNPVPSTSKLTSNRTSGLSYSFEHSANSASPEAAIGSNSNTMNGFPNSLLADRTQNMSPDSAKAFGLDPNSDTARTGASQTSEEWHWEHIAAQRISAWDAKVERRWGHLPPLQKKAAFLAEQRRLTTLVKGPCQSIFGGPVNGSASPVPSMSFSDMTIDSNEFLSELNSAPRLQPQATVTNLRHVVAGIVAESEATPSGAPGSPGPVAGAEQLQRIGLYPKSSELFKDLLTGIVNFLPQAPTPPDPNLNPREFSSKYGDYVIKWRNLIQQTIDRIEVDPHIPNFVTNPPVRALAINFVSIDDADISAPPQAIFLDKAGVLIEKAKKDTGVTKADVCAAIRDYLLRVYPPKICPFPTIPCIVPTAAPMPTALPRFVRFAVDEAGRLQVLAHERSGDPLWGGAPEIFVFCAPLTDDFADKMGIEDNLAEALKDVKVSVLKPQFLLDLVSEGGASPKPGKLSKGQKKNRARKAKRDRLAAERAMEELKRKGSADSPISISSDDAPEAPGELEQLVASLREMRTGSSGGQGKEVVGGKGKEVMGGKGKKVVGGKRKARIVAGRAICISSDEEDGRASLLPADEDEEDDRVICISSDEEDGRASLLPIDEDDAAMDGIVMGDKATRAAVGEKASRMDIDSI